MQTRTRNHNGYLLRWDGEGSLFNPGEGTQRQMIHAGVSASQITRICLTHIHGDHCYGLPGVLSRMVLDRVTHPVHLHYPASGGDIVRALVSVASPAWICGCSPTPKPGSYTYLEVQPLRHRVEDARLPAHRTCRPKPSSREAEGGGHHRPGHRAACNARGYSAACGLRT